VFYLINFLFAGGPPPIVPSVLPPVAGLKLWLDGSDVNGDHSAVANGAAITRWADKSGLGNDATTAGTAPTWAAGAVNGHGVVAFEHSPLQTASSASFAFTSATIFLVAGNVSDLSHLSIGVLPSDFHELLIYDQRIYHHTQPSNFTSLDFADPPAGTYIHAAIFGTGIAELASILNGVASTAAVSSWGSPGDYEAVARTATIGGRPLDASLHSTIAEVLVYDHALSASDQDLVGAYLAAKYGIAAYGHDAGKPTAARR
jgi:hypothetical protein